MATNGDANDQGYTTPGGADLITDGDEAISGNARVCAQHYLDVQAWQAAHDNVATGLGNPNDGPVYKAAGALYSDRNGTNGARLWINTGSFNAPAWRVIAGDTGWLDVTASGLLPDTIADVDLLSLRRINEMVYLSAQFRFIAETQVTTDPGIVPAGFRPGGVSATNYAWITVRSIAGDPFTPVGAMAIQSNGKVQISAHDASRDVRMTKSWLTTQAWPATL